MTIIFLIILLIFIIVNAIRLIASTQTAFLQFFHLFGKFPAMHLIKPARPAAKYKSVSNIKPRRFCSPRF